MYFFVKSANNKIKNKKCKKIAKNKKEKSFFWRIILVYIQDENVQNILN